MSVTSPNALCEDHSTGSALHALSWLLRNHGPEALSSTDGDALFEAVVARLTVTSASYDLGITQEQARNLLICLVTDEAVSDAVVTYHL